MTERSSWEIIGDRFLDTRLSSAHLQANERALRAQGITGWRRLLMEYLACVGLSWNLLWWDADSLNGSDIASGWGYHAFLQLLCLLVFGLLLSVKAALIICLLFHLLVVVLGLGLRAGTRPVQSQ